MLLVTQRGVVNFVAWLGEPGETIRLTAEAFRIAPRDLARRLSLRQTVELVRIATDVFEQRLPPLAADEAERRLLMEAVLRFGRGAAFAAATAYAAAAEARGAWDARLEALVVDAVVRGPHDGIDPSTAARPGRGDDVLVSRAAALGWPPASAGARGRRRRHRSRVTGSRRAAPPPAADEAARARRGAGRAAGRAGHRTRAARAPPTGRARWSTPSGPGPWSSGRPPRT